MIKLTLPDGTPTLVNPQHITTVVPLQGEALTQMKLKQGSGIFYVAGAPSAVKESPTEIHDLIKGY